MPERRRWPATARWGAALVLFFVFAAVAAPWLSPSDPTTLHDRVGGRNRPPLSRLQEVETVSGRRFLADRVELRDDAVVLVQRGRESQLPRDQVRAGDEGRLSRPRWFLLGTDRVGRDQLSRLLWGARVSLSIGVLAVFVALTVGVLVGGSAALGPSWLDSLLMRIVDALLAFPSIFLILTLAALFRPSRWLLVVILGGTAWMGVSRLVRGELQSLRERDFVLAARGQGQRTWRIFWRQLLPNTWSPVVVQGSLLVADVILAEAALSFLGMGVRPPTASWGNMVADGRDLLPAAWWISTFPGAALALTVIGFNLLGDGLRDHLSRR